jgi:DNA (cytosine-5)-methyltransferase 1
LLPTPATTDSFGPNKPGTRGGSDALRTVACYQLFDRELLRSPTLSDTKTPDRSGLRAANGHQTNLADQIEARFGSSSPLLSTPTAMPFTSRSGDRIGEPGLRGQAYEMETDWGKYGDAITLWEQVIGRKAPAPTEPNRNNRPRLAATFPEWMMGWPKGTVTDPEIGLSRSAQLKIIGNGVCPQQAALALLKLLEME